MWGVKSASLQPMINLAIGHLVMMTVFLCYLPFILSLENVRCSPEYWLPAKLSAGYNTVVRIPAGATSIDVRQHSFSGKPEDDNYLGKSSFHDVSMNPDSSVSSGSSRYARLPSSRKLPSIKGVDLEIHYLLSSPEFPLRILTQGLYHCSIG